VKCFSCLDHRRDARSKPHPGIDMLGRLRARKFRRPLRLVELDENQDSKSRCRRRQSPAFTEPSPLVVAARA